jgi:hypothetical protein
MRLSALLFLLALVVPGKTVVAQDGVQNVREYDVIIPANLIRSTNMLFAVRGVKLQLTDVSIKRYFLAGDGGRVAYVDGSLRMTCGTGASEVSVPFIVPARPYVSEGMKGALTAEGLYPVSPDRAVAFMTSASHLAVQKRIIWSLVGLAQRLCVQGGDESIALSLWLTQEEDGSTITYRPVDGTIFRQLAAMSLRR